MAKIGPRKYFIDGTKLKEMLDEHNWNSKELVDQIEVHLHKTYDSTTIDKIINGETKNPYKSTADAIKLVLIKELGYTENELKDLIYSEEIDPPKKYYTDIKNLYPDKFEELEKYWIESKVIEYDKFSSPEENKKKPINLITAITESIENYNVVLYGDSGLGKSFSCLKLINTLHNDSNNKLVPLLIKLPFIGATIETKIQKRKKKYGLGKENLIIFFDGLNEVGDSIDQQKKLLQIMDYLSRNSNHRIIITTQVLNDPIKNIFSNYKFFSVQPFDGEDIVKYLKNFKNKFKSKKEAQEFYDDFEGYLKDFISKPKVLNILATVYEKGKHLKITSPIELFNKYEEFLCGGRNERFEMKEEIRKHFIPFLAYQMSLNLQSRISSEQFYKYINEFNSDSTNPKLNDRDIIVNLVKNYNILRVKDNEEYEFIHDFIREYFVGKYWKIKSYDNEKVIGEVYKHTEENSFLLNSLKFYVGLVDEDRSKELIKKIIGKNVFEACDLFVWSSINKYDKELIKTIINLFSKNHIEYRYESSVILFYLKVLDVLPRETEANLIIYAKYLMNLGKLYRTINESKAKRCFQIAMDILKNNKKEIANLIRCHYNLGFIYKVESNYKNSIKYYNNVIKLSEKYNLNNSPIIAESFKELGELLCKRNQNDDISYSKVKVNYYQKAINSFEKYFRTCILSSNKDECLDSYFECNYEIGIIYYKKKDYLNTISYFENIAFFRKEMLEKIPYIIFSLNHLGICYKKISKYKEAIKVWERCLDLIEKKKIGTIEEYKLCMLSLIIIYYDELNYKGALNYLKKYEDYLTENNEIEHIDYLDCCLKMSKCYYKLSDFEKAKKYVETALPIYTKEKLMERVEMANELLLTIENEIQKSPQTLNRKSRHK